MTSHAKYRFTNIIGTFIFDADFNLIDKGEDIKDKYKETIKPEGRALYNILKSFNNPEYLKQFYKANIKITKSAIKESTGKDNLIIQAVNSVEDLKVIANKLAKRLREWYELHNPEFSRSIADHARFAELITLKSRNELLKKIGISESASMGSDLEQGDIDAILLLAEEIKAIYRTKANLEKYIDTAMTESCPNITALAGSIIGAKLLEHAGSFKKLMQMPASTVQLLGAEKALFRHLKTGARCPKYGIILQHQLVAKAKDKAKAARMLADKIALAAKVDYFKGDFIGDKMRKELGAKIR
ncbi:MAG: hypothetical protein U9R34_04045 [Nanoarchaeota archaeon]|nr:hypothetical protein [Nanoarchaeota archaeon]